ncbi:PucR family transcriptional regulator [Gordonia sp. OPL2]|uniref:PucR family transcriptional regulator n=1 Tax=Gordonia sp. OPL2 TaxID=2486274 RepID=UPI00165579AA|nr:PucR family transcriptional regulator [Gordonia sp. OPL2]ROZ99322.1 PucR family transcriptional regulator [Gordonia sp. OPL2]
MALTTIADLVAMRHLRLNLRGGASGVDRSVTWAQTSDLDSPWDWMTGGELLMKNGRTMPAAADDQVQFVNKLADHAISGLVLGIDPETPTIDAEALSAADTRGFPIIVAPYSVGFGAIGRAVADQNVSDESRRLALTGRVYTMIRRSVADTTAVEVMQPLARDLACQIAVLDAETGRSALDDGPDVPAELQEAVVSEVRRRGGALPGVVHLESGGNRAHLVDVPDEEPTVLLTHAFRAEPPDIVLLQHIATAAAVLLAQQGIRREHERRIGGELLAALVDGRVGDVEARVGLTSRGLFPESSVLVACAGGRESDEHRVHLSLHRRAVPNLLLRRAGVLYALLSDSREAAQILHRRLGPRAALGVSDPLGVPNRAPDAAREANWALRAAETAPGRISRYAEASPLAVMRDTEEARLFVDRTLSDVAAYDESHGSELLKTLDTFLSCDRSWQQAAVSLGVHRQTVVYRIRRVEELTGRNLSVTGHISEMWLALRARDLLRTSRSTRIADSQTS